MRKSLDRRCKSVCVVVPMAFVIVQSLWAQPQSLPVDVLKAAQALGAVLKSEGYVYPKTGLPVGTKTIDCTQFVLRVVEQLIPGLPASARSRIAINDLDGQDVASDKDGIVSKADPRTKGVQQALVDLNRGEVVPLSEAQPGDLIQYWMQQSDGKWFGHAGIVERVNGAGADRRAWIFGSHRSEDGIGTAPSVGLRLIEEPKRRIYLVRFKA